MRFCILFLIITTIALPVRLYPMGDTSGNRPEFDASRLKPWDVSVTHKPNITSEARVTASRYNNIRHELAQWIDRQAHAVRNGYIEQLGLPVRGLWTSYEDSPSKWSKYLAYYGRIFTYDTALALYTSIISDCYKQDFSRSRQAVDVILQLLAREEAVGQIGLLHFSYNTKEDSFIDPRAITGANIWMFKALYAYMLTSGDFSVFEEVTRCVRKYLLPLQVLDDKNPMYGFITAGYAHPKGMDQGGYRIYSNLKALNKRSEIAVMEHNADLIDLLRLINFAVDAYSAFADDSLRNEIADRHALVMQSVMRIRNAPHWPTLIESGGSVNRSMAVDHYTWLASAFIGLDESVAWDSIEVLRNKFVVTVDSMEILIGPIPRRLTFARPATGLIFFEKSFYDPYVTISANDRHKLELMIQPEATAGGIIFLYLFSQATSDPDREAEALSLMETLLEGLSIIHESYSSACRTRGMPYATENTENYFNSTPSMAAGASYYMALEVLATGYPYFLGVPVPESFSDALIRQVDSTTIRASSSYKR